MKHALIALIAGLLFGVGLSISGMMNPEKVLGFLDVAGNWDPTLAFVMGGALLITVPAYAIAKRRAAPILENAFSLPLSQVIDRNLVLGASLFGIGWGLVGFCPGPAIAALSLGYLEVGVFLIAMGAGMLLRRFVPA